MSRWGLLGTWSLDCTKAASNANGYLSYVVKDRGRVAHERNFGDRRDSNEVLQATLAPDGSIALTVHFKELSQTRKWIIVRGSDGRVRTISNNLVNTNEYTIKDGKFTANGNPTSWQARCR